MSMRASILGCICGLSVSIGWAHAQEHRFRSEVNVWKPEKTEATDDLLDDLKKPAHVKIARFADAMGNARMLAVGDDGSVYVTRSTEGDVIRLRDVDGDGKAEVRETVATLPHVHGICLHEGRMYLSTVKEVYVCSLSAGGEVGTPRKFISDLPDGGQHPKRTLAIGPDGGLYISIGSTCNSCNETNPEHASMVRVPANLLAPLSGAGITTISASQREIFATGLRNTLAFDWHPRTGELFGVDQGIDDLGDDEHGEEFNLIVKGKHYGWPHIYDNGTFNNLTFLPPGLTLEQAKERNTAPIITHTPHASPIAMVYFADAGQRRATTSDARDRMKNDVRPAAWPKEYLDDALVTFRGSWNRKPPSGYELVRVVFEDAKPRKIERFVGPFLTDGGKKHFGRIAGLAWAADGALLMSDDTGGVIYRLWIPEKASAGNGNGASRHGD